MIFTPTEFDDVLEIASEPHVDSRGFFARLFCPEELKRAGLKFESNQINLSRNTHAFTLRGMHYQDQPHAEAKIVRVTRGATYDVVVDVRPGSATRYKWLSRVLDSRRANALFVPEGFALGFLTLEPDTDVVYQMGRPHLPGLARGLLYDDPRLGIAWPARPLSISEQDQAWPLLPAGDS